MRQEDEFWSTEQTAAYLNRPEGTVRQWRHKGDGPPSFRMRGKVMYRRSGVERWVRDQEAAEQTREAA